MNTQIIDAIKQVNGFLKDSSFSLDSISNQITTQAASIAMMNIVQQQQQLHTLQNAVTDSIRSKYRGASNFRLGAEGRFDMVFVRLGLGYYGSPFQKSYANAERIDVSGGVGFRFDNWFADLGYVRSMYSRQEVPYSTGYTNISAPTAEVGSTLNNVALTIGLKF